MVSPAGLVGVVSTGGCGVLVGDGSVSGPVG